MVNLKGKPVVSFCVHGLCVDCRVIRQLLLQSEGDWHQKIWFGNVYFACSVYSRGLFIRGRRLISKRDLVHCSCIDTQRIGQDVKHKAQCEPFTTLLQRPHLQCFLAGILTNESRNKFFGAAFNRGRCLLHNVHYWCCVYLRAVFNRNKYGISICIFWNDCVFPVGGAGSGW